MVSRWVMYTRRPGDQQDWLCCTKVSLRWLLSLGRGMRHRHEEEFGLPASRSKAVERSTMGGRTTHLLVIGGIPDYPKKRFPEQGLHTTRKEAQNALVESWQYSRRTSYPRRFYTPLRPNCVVVFFRLLPSSSGPSALLYQRPTSPRILRGFFPGAFRTVAPNFATALGSGALVHHGLACWRSRSEGSGQPLVRFVCGWVDEGTYTPCDNHYCNFVMFRYACTTD